MHRAADWKTMAAGGSGGSRPTRLGHYADLSYPYPAYPSRESPESHANQCTRPPCRLAVRLSVGRLIGCRTRPSLPAHISLAPDCNGQLPGLPGLPGLVARAGESEAFRAEIRAGPGPQIRRPRAQRARGATPRPHQQGPCPGPRPGPRTCHRGAFPRNAATRHAARRIRLRLAADTLFACLRRGNKRQNKAGTVSGERRAGRTRDTGTPPHRRTARPFRLHVAAYFAAKTRARLCVCVGVLARARV